MIFRAQPNIIRIGAEHLLDERQGITYEILEIITHPGYVAQVFYNDIALIKFKHDSASGAYPPGHFACLPPEHLIYDEDIIYDPSQWGEMEALGYGATSFGMFEELFTRFGYH